MKRWLKENKKLLFGILCFIAGAGVMARVVAMPVVKSITVGTVLISNSYISVYLLAIAALLFMLSGALIVVHIEAEAYYNRRSFFDSLGIKKKEGRMNGRNDK